MEQCALDGRDNLPFGSLQNIETLWTITYLATPVESDRITGGIDTTKLHLWDIFQHIDAVSNMRRSFVVKRSMSCTEWVRFYTKWREVGSAHVTKT
jgi:hypothetical protein